MTATTSMKKGFGSPALEELSKVITSQPVGCCVKTASWPSASPVGLLILWFLHCSYGIAV